MTALDADGTVDFLAVVLADTPKLDGAACDRQHTLFDAARPGEDPDDLEYRHGAAATICQTRCPALEECERWLDSLPTRHRPAGVIAGRIPEPARPAGRPRKAPTMNIRIRTLTSRPDDRSSEAGTRGKITLTASVRNNRLDLALPGIGRVELDREGALQLAHYIADEGERLR